MGRPRTPIATRILDGNPSKRPIPKPLDVPPLDGSTPENLSPDARHWYERVVPEIRKYIKPSQLDESALVMLAIAWGTTMQAQRQLSREGLTRDGQRHPAAAILRDQAALFMQIAGKFGLTPSDRTRFAVVEPKPPRRHSTLDGEWFPEDEMEEIKKEEMMQSSTLPPPVSATKPA
jgi:P27 family predicted phage terminase small subunit